MKSLLAVRRSVLLAAVAALAAEQPAPVAPPARMALQEASRRVAPSYAPVHEGEPVTVRGVATAPAISIIDYRLLPIQDESGYGFFIEESKQNLNEIRVGDTVEASGTIARRGGMPVLLAGEVRILASGAAPSPRAVPVEDVRGFRYMGMYVQTEATVLAAGENSGGSYLALGDKESPLRIFLPRNHQAGGRGLTWLSPGDRVRVVGYASQYCPIAPHDRFFQILVSSAGSVTILQSGPAFPLEFLFVVALALVLGAAAWMWRETRLNRQRASLRALNTLGEEILAAGSAGEILRKLEVVIPKIARYTGVRLYLLNRGTQKLERVPGGGFAGPAEVDMQAPANSAASGAALCLRNRALLAIPDTHRSPLFQASEISGLPRSVMYVPLFAQTELLGVLELDHDFSPRGFPLDEQAGAQHLGNQIGVALKLIEQQSIQEQLFRSEKLAAAGQLISGIANELRDPLHSISEMAQELVRRKPDGLAERDLRAIASEAERAAGIVSRLVSFSRPEVNEAGSLELHGLLKGLLLFRKHECDLRGIQLRSVIPEEPVYVSGAQGQLEHVFLNLLVHAEQSQRLNGEKSITVSTSLLARRVLIAIGYTTAPREGDEDDLFGEDASAAAGALGLGVCRGIIQSHGGEIRFLRTTASNCRFEVELPVQTQLPPDRLPAPAVKTPSRFVTAMVVDPDAAVQKQLVAALSGHGFRVVPVPSAEEAIDLIERLRFDLTLCSVRLPGLNWIEFFERVRGQLGIFVLMTEGFDENVARIVESAGGLILQTPVDPAAVSALLQNLDARLQAVPAN